MSQDNLDIKEDSSIESLEEESASDEYFLSSEEEFVETSRTTRKKSNASKSSSNKSTAKKPKTTSARKVREKPPAPAGKPTQVILDYIVKSHLPFTLTLLFENLHRIYPKKEFERTLETLVKSGDLITKKCNKTFLWWPNAAKLNAEEITPETINKVSDNNKALEAEILTLNETINTKERDKRKLNAMMTIDELKRGIESFKIDNEVFSTKIKEIVDSGNSITEETFNKEKENFTKNYKIFKKYTSICNTMAETLSDESNRKKCFKKLDIEYLENEIKELNELSKTLSK
eukprot:GAHX01002966.1.p1 GENE.GAHX01002966.1~~GAHX01002966.1.p1  ORF type:complete len:302 (+),score=68.61 GAHX01002966.1:41-907(+)